MAAAAPPAPGSLNFTAVNVWGLSQYDGEQSRKRGDYLALALFVELTALVHPLLRRLPVLSNY